uniref:Uncharacterized protein n=1 Tax=viral metagenome TaxID=1070528 RepID=A0A6C0ENN0_9ZZZZ
MDFIDMLIIFVVFFNICIFIWLCDLLIYTPLNYLFFEEDNFGDLGKSSYFIITTFSETFPSFTLIFYYLITILFLIMYFIYLFILFVIPETGFPTLFIPVRELLLSIPPLPALINKGVFNFYKSLFGVLGITGDPSIANFSKEYYYFSKDGTYEILQLFNPYLDVDKVDTVIEYMNNNNKKSEIKNLKKDVDVCIDGNSDFITPDSTYTDILKNNINDVKNNVKCNLKSITPYIETETT